MSQITKFTNGVKQLLGFRILALVAFGILTAFTTVSGSFQRHPRLPSNLSRNGKEESRKVVGESIGAKQSNEKTVRLPGEVPAALKSATKLRSTTTEAPLTLTIVLKRTDQQGFDQFVASVQDSKSASFRKYLNPREQA